jgi:AraC-like DNA-binding protein
VNEPTAPCRDLRAVLGAFESLGLSRTALLEAASLDPRDLDDPDARFSYDVTRAIFRRALAERPLPNLGVSLARLVPMGAYEVVDYLVTTSDDVGEGLRRLARYFRLISELIALRIDESASGVRVELAGTRGSIPPFGVEFTVTLTLKNLREEAAGPFGVEAVHFRHEPDDVAGCEAVFGCRVICGSTWDGFSLSTAAARMTMRRRDPMLREVLDRHARELVARLPDTGGVDVDVRQALARRVADGDSSIDAVARALGTTPRTLQRRLRDAGTSFQALHEEARSAAARRYLENTSLSAGEIAYLLGYSEPSAFHRAFRRWTGETPESWRRTNR